MKTKRSYEHHLNRRDCVKLGFGVLGAAALPFSGCVPAGGNGSIPELVWGRRGLSNGRFLKPRAITIDHLDQLYIVDTTGRIQVFDGDGALQRVWSTPQTANGRPTGLATRAAVKKDGQPRLFVADTHYYQMLTYTSDGTLLDEERIGGTPGHSPGEFAFVTDAVSDDDGNFYIGEYGDSDRIQKFDADGNFVTQWGGTGNERGKFVRPQSLVVDGHTLWVVDACNHRIQRFDISQTVPELVSVWGSEGDGKGQFYYPYDMALADDGTLIVCEYGNQRLQRLTPEGKWIAYWGGPGFEPGQLYQPWGVVVDSINKVHVLDSNNHRVQRLKMFS